ncbi:MAG: hypothetical protein A4S17_00585 [Proteobacteria bacterium HN_bin10]|nr:MAG: hypothetical protein A4S17_00585 [Proteobacteria bacterium HN_bin10]
MSSAHRKRLDNPLERASLRALRAFDVLAREKNYRAAAAELGVSVSALSHQIRKLEASLGATLVVSQGRRVELTASGAALAASLSPAFETIRNGLAGLGRFGAFRLRICPLLASALIAERWETIENSFGEAIDFQLTPSPTLSSCHDADATLSLITEPTNHHAMEIIHAASLQPFATHKVRDVLHRGGAVHWIVCEQWRDGLSLWGACANVEIAPSKLLLADGLSSAHTACTMGAGIALLPEELTRAEQRANRLAPVFPGKPHLAASFALLHPAESVGVDRAKRLARVLRQNTKICFGQP